MSLRRDGGRRIRGRDSWGRCDDILLHNRLPFCFIYELHTFSREESSFFFLFPHVDNGWFSAAYEFGSGPDLHDVDGGL